MTQPRLAQASDFKNANGWEDAQLRLIAGDASNRKYYRLEADHGRAILMDAPPDKGEDVRPFVRIATYLSSTGLSAPDILAQDTEAGFLILEDFGDDLFARLLETGAASEAELYTAATDVLLALHAKTPPNLPRYDAKTMADMAALSVVWYVNDGAEDAQAEHMRALLEPIFAPLDGEDQVLIQRDYHAENLLWLPERQGAQRVGLLDFQDAMLGHKAYDLVSVLQDARRDVSPDVAAQMRAHYVSQSGSKPDAFAHAYHLLGLQRNLRILGVFARLCIRDGKQSYIDLIPRVWDHVLHNLNELNIPALTDFVSNTLPAPSPQVLDRLRSKCATSQTQ